MAVKPVEIAQLPQTIKKLANAKDAVKMKLGKAKFIPWQKAKAVVKKTTTKKVFKKK